MASAAFLERRPGPQMVSLWAEAPAGPMEAESQALPECPEHPDAAWGAAAS